MAKHKMVAKVRFDDGSKKGPGGKSLDYNIGEEYQGDASMQKKAMKEGLICNEGDLQVTKETVDAKDLVIEKLEGKIAELNKVISELEKSIMDLQEKLELASKK